MSDPMRYLLNLGTGALHDRQHLDERCNTDQIERRDRWLTNDAEAAKAHLAFRKLCAYCQPRRFRSNRHPRLQTVPNPDAPTPT
jgi:hypothetical protein